MKFDRGDVIIALAPCDPSGANVQTGDMGVVFQPENYHEPDTGPLVRWLNDNLTVCNIMPNFIRKVTSIEFRQRRI